MLSIDSNVYRTTLNYSMFVIASIYAYLPCVLSNFADVRQHTECKDNVFKKTVKTVHVLKTSITFHYKLCGLIP